MIAVLVFGVSVWVAGSLFVACAKAIDAPERPRARIKFKAAHARAR